jgi:hypothetical protein
MSDTPSKPVFVQLLRDTTINEGQKLKLHAAVNAHPEPEVTNGDGRRACFVLKRNHDLIFQVIWYRNDIPLKNSRDLLITFDGQLCTLVKDRCEKENDTGIYRITAVNSMGQAESVCQVIVQSSETQSSRERLQTNRPAPVAVSHQPPQQTTTQQEEKMVVETSTNELPTPQMSWFKENQSMMDTYEHQVCVTLEHPRTTLHSSAVDSDWRQ